MKQLSKNYTFFDIKTNPQHLLIFLALLIFMFSLFMGDALIDINLHDTYFVIAYSLLYRAIAVALLIFWAFYMVADKLLPLIALRWLHVLITALFSLVLIIKTSMFAGLSGPPRRYYAFAEFEQQTQRTYLLVYLIAALLIGQLFFIANFITGVIRTTSSPAK